MTYAKDELEQGEAHPTLGPGYFAAQNTAERFMADFDAKQFKPLAEEFAAKFQDQLWGDISQWLLADTESNLQIAIHSATDNSVAALLMGERWAVDRYVFGTRHDAPAIRETIARSIPQELQDARVADLEREVARLKGQLRLRRDYE